MPAIRLFSNHFDSNLYRTFSLKFVSIPLNSTEPWMPPTQKGNLCRLETKREPLLVPREPDSRLKFIPL